MVLCAGAFGCYAAQGSLPGAQGQGYDLNLSYSRTTLKAVADAITQQVGIAFSYETALAGYPMENLQVLHRIAGQCRFVGEGDAHLLRNSIGNGLERRPRVG